MVKWKQNRRKKNTSWTFAWFVSTYFARILYSGCQRHKLKKTHYPIHYLSPLHFLSLYLVLSLSLTRRPVDWRTVWLSDVSLRFHPRLIDVRQQKSWHLLCCCRLHSQFPKSFHVFHPLFPSPAPTFVPLFLFFWLRKTLTEISHRVQRRHPSQT